MGKSISFKVEIAHNLCPLSFTEIHFTHYKELVHTYRAYVELWMHIGSLESDGTKEE